MLTIISCLVGAGLLFRQMTMETALTEAAVKCWSGERALPCTLGGCTLPLLSGLRYLCPSRKQQTSAGAGLQSNTRHNPGDREGVMVCSLLSDAQPQPTCRASFECLGYVSGILGWGVDSLSSSSFSLSRQSLMLYMEGKALLTFRAACLRCGWNL